MKFEETKKELKERWSKSIDVLNQGHEKWQKAFNTAVNKKFEKYPTEQLMIIIQHWPEDKNQEVIADSWKELEDEANNNNN